jgi:hypothetical protein
MSTPASPSTVSAERRLSAAPYAQPQASVLPANHGEATVRLVVGPYVPAPWRGKPVVDGPRLVTPALAMPSVAMPLGAMPPAYPTPAYFTPLASVAQEDVLAAVFELPTSLDDRAGLSMLSLVDPSVEPIVEPVAEPGAEPGVEPGVEHASSLPWIDAFLSSTPAMPMQAIPDEPPPSYTPPRSEAIVDEAVASEWPMTEAAPEAPTPSDAWALDEAAEQMRALADELRDHEGIASGPVEVARLFDESAAPEPLPVWSDDDMIDIMPLQQIRPASPLPSPLASPTPPSSPRRTPIGSAPIEPWADRARRAGDESSEAAARALELLARRVRDGEISLAGYEPRLGDAAALAAALAALLGVRR